MIKIINLKENQLLLEHIAPYNQVCFELAKGNPYYEASDTEEPSLIYRPEYVKEVLEIALKLYKSCNFSDDITLVFENTFEAEECLSQRTFIESCIQFSHRSMHSFQYKEQDHEVYTVHRYSWIPKQMNLNKLFNAIILSDIVGGEKSYELAGKIFLIDNRTETIFFLYDDRGVDVFSKDKSLLKQLFNRFSQHLLQEERDNMQQMLNEF